MSCNNSYWVFNERTYLMEIDVTYDCESGSAQDLMELCAQHPECDYDIIHHTYCGGSSINFYASKPATEKDIDNYFSRLAYEDKKRYEDELFRKESERIRLIKVNERRNIRLKEKATNSSKTLPAKLELEKYLKLSEAGLKKNKSLLPVKRSI